MLSRDTDGRPHPSLAHTLPLPLLSQDAPFWKATHPDLPFWQLPGTVFVTTEFATWEKRMLRETAVAEREKATAAEDLAAVPATVAGLQADVQQLKQMVQNLMVS
jgi:hypothetical protein